LLELFTCILLNVTGNYLNAICVRFLFFYQLNKFSCSDKIYGPFDKLNVFLGFMNYKRRITYLYWLCSTSIRRQYAAVVWSVWAKRPFETYFTCS